MKLSIIVPIYNVEKYLQRCLDSIVLQMTNEVELIAVNDGATDGSFDILKACADKDSRIIVLSQSNKGLSEARNSGLRMSKGDYVWFVDSDDKIESGAIERVLSAVKDNPKIDVFAFDTRIVNEQKPTETIPNRTIKGGIYTAKNFFRDAYIFPYSGAQFYIMRKDLLIEKGLEFKKGIYYEDLLFTPSLLSSTEEICYIKNTLYTYYIRSGSIMTTGVTLKKCNDLLKVLDMLVDRGNQAKKDDEKFIYNKAAAVLSGRYYKYYQQLPNVDKPEARRAYLAGDGYLSVMFKAKALKYVARYVAMIFSPLKYKL